MAAPPSGSSGDPYDVLGVSRDATPRQVKLAYRKLSLRYHPDRQRRVGPGAGGDTGGGECSQSSDGAVMSEATDRFAEVARAYAILGDPERRAEHDRLRRLGAFDGPADEDGRCATPDERYDTSCRPSYGYAEDYSGGYYRKDYVPPPDAPGPGGGSGGGFGGARFNFGAGAPPPGAFTGASARAARDVFNSMNNSADADSFFDDLLRSPRNKSDSGPTGAGAPAAGKGKGPRPGIGFSLAPLGKHLSVHVPSRHEVVSSMISGDVHPAAHLFGTRVTFSEHRSVDNANCLSDNVRDLGCGTGCAGNAVDDDELSEGHQAEAEGEAGSPGSAARSTESPGAKNSDGAAHGSPGKSPGRPRSGTPSRRPVRTIVSTTTRIARGQRRIVTRTAHVHGDGSREILVEEGGAVVRRYVEPAPGDGDGCDAGVRGDGPAGEEAGRGRDGHDGGFSVMGAIRQCFAPCAAIES